MNKINILLMALASTSLMSCLSDEGNYDYTQLGTVDITGLDDSYRFILQEKVNLQPVVKTDIDQERLTYCWRVGADTLSKTKDLEYTFVKVPTSTDPLTFEVYDKATDVRYAKQMTMTWFHRSTPDGSFSLMRTARVCSISSHTRLTAFSTTTSTRR